MRYAVYILACYKGKDFSCYYTGQTNYLKRRLKQHYKAVKKKDTKKFTGRFDYVKLVWYKKVMTRKGAVKEERHIKTLTQPGKENYMDQYGKILNRIEK
ncbi:MAG: GIY-YIG nuclease family protein [Nanoarchaeota archaeon]